MDLATFRRSKGLSQEECALELGVTSKGLISGIENGGTASLKLALTIERWSAGAVPAASLNPDAARLGARTDAGAPA